MPTPNAVRAAPDHRCAARWRHRVLPRTRRDRTGSPTGPVQHTDRHRLKSTLDRGAGVPCRVSSAVADRAVGKVGVQVAPRAHRGWWPRHRRCAAPVQCGADEGAHERPQPASSLRAASHQPGGGSNAHSRRDRRVGLRSRSSQPSRRVQRPPPCSAREHPASRCAAPVGPPRFRDRTPPATCRTTIRAATTVGAEKSVDASARSRGAAIQARRLAAQHTSARESPWLLA